MAELCRLPAALNSVDGEQALLGGLMLDPTAWVRIASLVVAADFYGADHRRIFAAIASLQADRQAIDAVTVADHLERQGTLGDAGGLAYIAQLAKDTPSAANVETYARLVRERSSLRRLKAIVEQIGFSVTNPGERSAAELIASGQQALWALQSQIRIGKGLVPCEQLVGEMIRDLDTRSEGPTGLRVGLPDFDELTCGLEAGDLVVMAARPGMGKTALMVSVAATVSRTTAVAVFSAEMPARQLIRRAVALEAEIPQGLLRRSDLLNDTHWPKIETATHEIASRRLWIDEAASPTLTHVRTETLALNVRNPLGLVLIDYVQLVRGIGANRYEELRDVVYDLKALAKELALPVIVLAQLNRGVEARDDKRPHISDLRDSGAIEEAADIVALLYSEGYYNPSFAMPNVLECHVAKNRNGERGKCLCRFDGAFSRVTPLDSGAAVQYRRMLIKPKRREQDDL